MFAALHSSSRQLELIQDVSKQLSRKPQSEGHVNGIVDMTMVSVDRVRTHSLNALVFESNTLRWPVHLNMLHLLRSVRPVVFPFVSWPFPVLPLHVAVPFFGGVLSPCPIL